MLQPAQVWPLATAGSRSAPAASTIARRIRTYLFEQQPQQVTPTGVGAPQHSQQLVFTGSVRMASPSPIVVHLEASFKVKPGVHSRHADWRSGPTVRNTGAYDPVLRAAEARQPCDTIAERLSRVFGPRPGRAPIHSTRATAGADAGGDAGNSEPRPRGTETLRARGGHLRRPSRRDRPEDGRASSLPATSPGG